MRAGADNAIKLRVFDAADGSGRLLRFRSGHSAPPAHVRHYGQVGGWGVWVLPHDMLHVGCACT